MIEQRTLLLEKFTVTESLVVTSMSNGEEYAMIAKKLSIKPATVRFHAVNAARKIPGNQKTTNVK